MYFVRYFFISFFLVFFLYVCRDVVRSSLMYVCLAFFRDVVIYLCCYVFIYVVSSFVLALCTSLYILFSLCSYVVVFFMY